MGKDREGSGLFISLDGIDGCGKTTQARLLADWLRQQGHTVVTTRDPGGTAVGDRIRAILLDRDIDHMDRRCEMFLYMASRSQLVEEVIRPGLDAGRVVVSDRYLMANVAYQGAGGRLGLDTVEQVGMIATDGVLPDLVVVLDMDPAAARPRLKGDHDRMERNDLEFYKRVREAFLELAARDPEHTCVVNADEPIDNVAAAIRAEVTRVLEAHQGPHAPD